MVVLSDTAKEFIKDESSDNTEEVAVEFDSVLKKNAGEEAQQQQDDTLDEEASFYGFDEDGAAVQGIEEEPQELQRGMQRDYDVTASLKHTVNEPRTYEEALLSPEKHIWQTAMQEEISSLNDNHTWELVQLPPGRKVVDV